MVKKPPVKRNFTEEQVNEMLALYNSGLSYAKVAEKFDCHLSAVALRLKGKVQPRTTKETSRRYSADDNFFDVIDTEEKAYWLGFLYADGYVSLKKENSSNTLGCALASVDEPHLEKLKKSLQATNPIQRYEGKGYNGEGKPTYYSRLHIRSDKLVEDAIKHGIVPMKTSILMPPTTIPESLTHHFIRGYFDGDGSWAKTGKTFGYKLSVTGTEEFLLWMAQEMQLTPRLYSRHPDRDNNNFTLEAHARADVLKSIEYLYKDATIYLDRKYELATKIRPPMQ